jgi:hypothetical protein
MNSNKTGIWTAVFLILILVLQVYSIYTYKLNLNEHIQRDSLIQEKIDSINTSIANYYDHKLYINESLLQDNEKKIIKNKSIYKERENNLLHSPVDSVYLWTRDKLRNRSGK